MLVVASAVVVVAGTFSMISKNNNLVTVVEAFQQTKTSIPTFHRRQQEQQQEFLANLYKWNPTTTTTTTTTTRSSSSSPSSSSRLFMASQPPKVDKGFNLLEIATKVVPQGRIVQTTKESWKFIWKVSSKQIDSVLGVWGGRWTCGPVSMSSTISSHKISFSLTSLTSPLLYFYIYICALCCA